MRKASIASVLLGIGLATPVAANAFDLSTMRSPANHTFHHKGTLARATALVAQTPSLTMWEPALRETDGLSRNDDDCKYGCIDH